MKKDLPVYDIAHFTKEDIVVARFAPYFATHQDLRHPHRHNFYHLLLFTKGGGSHMIDFKNFPVQPYQMYFMIPGQVHSWSFEGEVDGYVINFSVPFFKAFLLNPDYIEKFPYFSGVLDNSVIILPENLRPDVHRIFESILAEMGTDDKHGPDMIKVLLVQLFITIGRLGFENPAIRLTAHNYTVARNFIRLLDQHVDTLKLPKEYAERLFITTNHLNAICHEVLGKSAGEVIRDRVILEAKRLMVNKELSISGVAYKLNFSDNSYFSKFFKKYAGMTPEDFRHTFLLTLVFLFSWLLAWEQSPTIDFISDTQQPLTIEKIIHFQRLNHNVKATTALFSDILKNKPAAVYMTGDLVSVGSAARTWRHVDGFLDSCRKDNIGVYGLLGNHDVMWSGEKGVDNFRRRFPQQVKTGYVNITDSIAIVMLNSNFKKLSPAEIDTEMGWYTSVLKELDSNSAVKTIIVCCHHAPYSNSRVVGSSAQVQHFFVPAFLQERKCRLFITGHAHAFEHFRVSGKDFLVIGGGGGIHQPLNTGSGSLPDLAAGHKPMFHYMSIQRDKDRLYLSSRFLRPDLSGVEKGYTFEIPLE